MAKEVELKVCVRDPEEFARKMDEAAQKGQRYHKMDTYFRGPGGCFRMRDSDGSLVVCRKEKTVKQGIEVSTEIEFAVPEALPFTAFCESLGFRVWYKKEKNGRAWRWREILVEEGEVSGLGHYAEFEILLDDSADDAAIEEARNKIREALTLLGIPWTDVEARSYSELLGFLG